MTLAASEKKPAALPAGREAVPVGVVTVRAVIIGAFLVALLSFLNPYLAFVIESWMLSGGSLMNGPILLLFLLVVANTALIRIRPGRLLTRTELLTIYVMMIVSVGYLVWGGLPFLVSVVTYPFYMASPGNHWQQLMWPSIPVWLRVNDVQAIDWFWEALPRGFGVPWTAWVQPGVNWSLFTVAMMAAMFCLGALLSRGWIERQRLTFPLVDVPLAITGQAAKPTLGTSLMRSRVFWIGFVIPASIGLVNWLHRFFPDVPAINLWGLDIGKNFVGLGLPWSILRDTHFSVMFEVLGIMCLVPGEISLSLWLFYILYKVQLLTWATFGVTQGGAASAVDPFTFIGFEESGAFIALSALIIYEVRQPIKQAWTSWFGRGQEHPAPYEPFAGRWALLGLVLSNGFMLWFGLRAGMQWWSFLLLMGLFYTIVLGCARLVAAGGVMWLAQGATSRQVAVRLVGAQQLGVTSLTMYAYLSAIYMDVPANLPLPQMMNSFKLAQSGIPGKSLAWVSAVAIGVMLAVSFPSMLKAVYSYGASTLGRWPFAEWPAGAVFDELDASLRTPETADNMLRLAMAVGVALMFGLVWLHTHIIWWPVSPIGFLMASSWEFDNNIWSNALMAWLLTTVIKRYGGLSLYRKFRPAFLGLVLGSFLSEGALALVNTGLDLHRLWGK